MSYSLAQRQFIISYDGGIIKHLLREAPEAIIAMISLGILLIFTGFIQKPLAKFIYLNFKFTRKQLDKNHAKNLDKLARTDTKPTHKWIFKKCPKNNILEIPIFKNRYLGYIATKDFGKYLTNIEVKEHPFMKKVSRKKGWEKSDDYFYAKFFFSENPKKGQLRLEWK